MNKPYCALYFEGDADSCIAVEIEHYNKIKEMILKDRIVPMELNLLDGGKYLITKDTIITGVAFVTKERLDRLEEKRKQEAIDKLIHGE